MNWNAPEKPAEFAENRLIQAIISGHFPINSNLPAERELAAQLGVTRPTLREALQRIARDGWIEIRHGKPTRVRNYWQEGNLGQRIRRRSGGKALSSRRNALKITGPNPILPTIK